MKLKDQRPPNPYSRNIQIALRVNEEEREQIQKMADQYADGNMSDFIRHAALKWKPRKDDIDSKAS